MAQEKDPESQKQKKHRYTAQQGLFFMFLSLFCHIRADRRERNISLIRLQKHMTSGIKNILRGTDLKNLPAAFLHQLGIIFHLEFHLQVRILIDICHHSDPVFRRSCFRKSKDIGRCLYKLFTFLQTVPKISTQGKIIMIQQQDKSEHIQRVQDFGSLSKGAEGFVPFCSTRPLLPVHFFIASYAYSRQRSDSEIPLQAVGSPRGMSYQHIPHNGSQNGTRSAGSPGW